MKVRLAGQSLGWISAPTEIDVLSAIVAPDDSAHMTRQIVMFDDGMTV